MLRRILLAATLAAVLAWPAVEGSHSASTLPLLSGEAVPDRIVAYLASRLAAPGCLPGWDGACDEGETKWFAFAVAHAGIDPSRWPSPSASVLGWLLADPDRLEQGPSNRAQELSKGILAVAAGGLDPRNVPVPAGGTRDLVARLLAEYDGTQFGDPELANDDAWAMIALNAVSYAGPETVGATVVVETATFPAVDDVSAATMALAPRGRDVYVARALAFLRESQIHEGPHRGCFPRGARLAPTTGAAEGSAESTAFAIQALVAAREDPLSWGAGGRDPISCLISFENGDGSVGPTADLIAEYETLAALSWAPYGSVRRPTTPLAIDREARAGSSVTLAVPDGFLRIGTERRASYAFVPTTDGSFAYHGFTWSGTPRPATVRIEVLPAIPAAPRLDVASSVPHGTPFSVRVAPADGWSKRLFLATPDGAIREGTEHAVTLAAAGDQTLVAWAENRLGERGPTASVVVAATNAAPSIAIRVPARAPRAAPVDLVANVTDPEGDALWVVWTSDGADLGVGTSLRLPPRAPGRVNVTAVVRDPWGGVAHATAPLTWVDAAPSVRVSAPSEAVAGPVEFAAAAEDPDGDPIRIAWTMDGQPVANGTVARLDLAPGDHVVTAIASTPYAESRDSVRVHVRRPDQPADASAPSAPVPSPPPRLAATVGPRGLVRVTIEAVDPGHHPELLLPDGTLASGREHEVALTPGTHRLRAWATDAEGRASEVAVLDVVVPEEGTPVREGSRPSAVDVRPAGAPLDAGPILLHEAPSRDNRIEAAKTDETPTPATVVFAAVLFGAWARGRRRR
ncbi:MAG: hypothetical protein ACT4PT_08150 [Methanobacteriota archaeon]